MNRRHFNKLLPVLTMALTKSNIVFAKVLCCLKNCDSNTYWIICEYNGEHYNTAFSRIGLCKDKMYWIDLTSYSKIMDGDITHLLEVLW